MVSGRDVGAAGAGVGKAAPVDVDKTSYKGLLSWFKVIRKDGDGGRFDQVLNLHPHPHPHPHPNPHPNP